MDTRADTSGTTYHNRTYKHAFDVWNEVPLLPQLTGMSCWAAAAAMIVSWRDRIAINPQEMAAGIGQWTAYRDGLHPRDVTALANRWGLFIEPTLYWSVSALRHMLVTKGPLWMGEASPGLHSIVVTGMYGDGTPEGSFVRINDPWPVGQGERYVISFRQLRQNYQMATDTVGIHAQLLHAGGRGTGSAGRFSYEEHESFSLSCPKAIDKHKEINMNEYTYSSPLHPSSSLNHPNPAGVIDARQTYLNTATFSIDPLGSHEGQGDNLFIRWNTLPQNIEAIDVVLHLHGYNEQPANLALLQHKVEISGTDLSLRQRPTLCIIPRGRKISEDELEAERESGHNPNPQRFTFPGLFANDGSGLEQLLAHTLLWFSRTYLGSDDNNGIPIARLIFTAHSGGGAALNKILRLHSLHRACNPHEIHLFDAVYGPPGRQGDGIISWASRHISADRTAGNGNIRPDMNENGGAMRIFYRHDNQGAAQWIAQQLVLPHLLGNIPSNLHSFYRVEPVNIPHNEIPKLLGPALLQNASTDVSSIVIANGNANGIGNVSHLNPGGYGTPIGMFQQYSDPAPCTANNNQYPATLSESQAAGPWVVAGIAAFNTIRDLLAPGPAGEDHPSWSTNITSAIHRYEGNEAPPAFRDTELRAIVFIDSPATPFNDYTSAEFTIKWRHNGFDIDQCRVELTENNGLDSTDLNISFTGVAGDSYEINARDDVARIVINFNGVFNPTGSGNTQFSGRILINGRGEAENLGDLRLTGGDPDNFIYAPLSGAPAGFYLKQKP